MQLGAAAATATDAVSLQVAYDWSHWTVRYNWIFPNIHSMHSYEMDFEITICV